MNHTPAYPHITAYTWCADYHCIACTHKRYNWLSRTEGEHLKELDMHGVPVNAKDIEGNPVHPVFQTDELPQRLGDTFGDDMRWYEPQETYSCGTCREEYSFLHGGKQ